jgi:hypothetical protein
MAISMKTINGKLMNQDSHQVQQIEIKFNDIFQEISKLEQLSDKNFQYHQAECLALTRLEKRLNAIENKYVTKLQKTFNSLEQNISLKLVPTITIIILGFGLFSTWLISKNKSSFCVSNFSFKTDSQLVDRSRL